jgi:hypothetical protein
MTMMRLLMEAVMVIAIVAGMVFMTKLSANENNLDDTLCDDENDDEASSPDETK